MHCTVSNEPKVGIQLLLISYLLPEPFVLATARIVLLVSLLFVAVLYSEPLRSLLPIKFPIFIILVYIHIYVYTYIYNYIYIYTYIHTYVRT